MLDNEEHKVADNGTASDLPNRSGRGRPRRASLFPVLDGSEDPASSESVHLNRHYSSRVIQFFNLFVVTTSVLSIATGMIFLAGSMIGGVHLQDLLRRFGSLERADAACFLLVGASLWLRNKKQDKVLPRRARFLGRALAAMVALLGFLRLTEYIFRLVSAGHQFGGIHTTSLRPLDALIFLFLGLGLLLLDKTIWRRRWLAQSMPVAAAIISLMGLLDVQSGSPDAPPVMAPISAVMLLFLSLALVGARTKWGLGGLLSSSDPGGILLRRFLPATVILPIAIAWVRWLVVKQPRWPDLTSTTVFPIVLLGAVTIWTALLIDRIDRERQRATSEAASSELRHWLLSENMLEGIVNCRMVFDEHQHPVDFIWLAVNSNFKQTTGLQDVIGKRATEVIPGLRDMHPELFEIFGRVALTGRPEKFEIEFRPSGRWLSISAYGVQKAQFVAVFDDVTERKAADASTRELAAIVEWSEYAIGSANLDGVIRSWNAGAQRVYGYGPEETLGNRMSILVPPGKQAESRELLTIVARGQCVHLETQGIRKDGTLIDVSMSVAPIRDAEQAVTGVSFITRDITEEKCREERLRLLGAALAAAVNSIVITDRDGKILWVNPAFTQLTGYAAEEVIGHTPRVLRSGQHSAEFYKHMWDTILSHGVWRGEVINRRKDGTLYTEEMTITPIRSDNGNEHFVAVKQDVTERKSLEDQFRQAQKMEAVGRLAGGIAHDFNNLLGVIGGYTAILEDRIRDDTTLTDIAEDVRNAVRSGAALTSQLLALSRKQLLVPQVLDLNLVVSETAKMLHRVLSEDIILNLSLDPDVGSVKADPGQLQQVIMNLAVNARDAMPRGGSLTITTTTANADLGCVQADNFVRADRYVTLALRDTGLGMDAETQRHAFEPFFTTKPEGQGTGLGLATVYGIVKQSGGYVSLSSELGKGTIVEVHLVGVDEKPQVKKVQTPSREPRNGYETILLVEDYLSLRKLVRAGLENNGYTVVTAGNGVEALDVVKSYKGVIDLLVTDVIMPGMDGPELAKRIAKQRPGISVLYTSGYADEMLGQHGVLSSDVAFIKKPFEMPDLMAKIRETLESNKVGEERPNSPAA